MKNKTDKKSKWPKLPPVFKRKWVKALRSGKFKQGTGLLKDSYWGDPIYCCLGVACEIGGLKNVPDIGTITTKKCKEATPKILHGRALGNNLVSKLIKMNDSGEFTFRRIATWIEKNL